MRAMTARTDKAALRQEALQRRRELVQRQGPQGRAVQSRTIAEHALTWLQEHSPTGVSGMTVLAYEQLRTEPPTADLIDRLRGAGVRVLLPITRIRHLDWSDGVQEFGPPVLAEVRVAFVPALLVGPDGTRLGRGRGYYDRVLPALPQGTPTIAVLHDHEHGADVPREPHDAPVTAVLTAAEGVRSPGRPIRAAPG